MSMNVILSECHCVILKIYIMFLFIELHYTIKYNDTQYWYGQAFKMYTDIDQYVHNSSSIPLRSYTN